MKASDIKEMLSIDDIVDLLYELDAAPIKKGDEVHCRTICHQGNKHKLIYREETRTFACFTDTCGKSMDIFVLIGRVFNVDFPTAFRYICGKFNINYNSTEFSLADQVDTSFIKKFEKKDTQHKQNEIPKKILNSYYKLYHKSWLEDGISIETMKKFNILFSIKENKIIIPHFDKDNRLLGVRGRALNEDEIDDGKKYMPVYHKKFGVLKHPTGGNIYGININKEKIKKTKSIILVESEKGVMQLDTMNSIVPGGGISGSSITDEQVNLLVDLGVENVILGLDKEWEDENEEIFYKEKIVSGFINKLFPYFKVSLLWDKDNLLDLKDAPTDKGVDVFEKLMENRIFI